MRVTNINTKSSGFIASSPELFEKCLSSIRRETDLDQIISDHMRDRFGEICDLTDDAQVSTSVYLYNLPMTTTEDDLREEYSFFGPVLKVKIILPGAYEQRFKSTELLGCVLYTDHVSAETALEAIYKVPFKETFLRAVIGQLVGILGNAPPTDIVRVKYPINPTLKHEIDEIVCFHGLHGLRDRVGSMSPPVSDLSTLSSEPYFKWRVHVKEFPDDEYRPYWFEGRLWVPPVELYEESRGIRQVVSGHHTLTDKWKLELLLKNELTVSRSSIDRLMRYCVDHSDSAVAVVGLIMAADLGDREIARLYLLSDLLFNSACSKKSAWCYRSLIQEELPKYFTLYRDRLKPKICVDRVFQAWKRMFSSEYLSGLESCYTDGFLELSYHEPLRYISIPTANSVAKEMLSLGLYFRSDGQDEKRLQWYKRRFFGVDADIDGSSLSESDFVGVDGAPWSEDESIDEGKLIEERRCPAEQKMTLGSPITIQWTRSIQQRASKAAGANIQASSRTGVSGSRSMDPFFNATEDS